MAASSCRSPRLRYSMTLASPCMVRIPRRIGCDRRPQNLERLEPCAKCLARQERRQPGFRRRLARGPRSGGLLVALAAAGAAGPGDRLVHEPADGARAAAALGTAAEAAIDLAGRAR